MLQESVECSRPADIDRVERLVQSNRSFLEQHVGGWLLGEVLVVMWNERATRRILAERGISGADIREGVLRVLGEGARWTTTQKLGELVRGEVRRLRRTRRAELEVVTESSGSARWKVVAAKASLSTKERRRRRPSWKLAADEYEPGQVVWVSIEETRRGRKSEIPHPAVLLSRTGRKGERWVIMALTTSPADDGPRYRVPKPEELGLHRDGFLWGGTLRVHKSQLGRAVGWVHRDLVIVIDRAVGLRAAERAELMAVADVHHRRGGTDGVSV